MTSGRLGAVDLAAATNTSVYFPSTGTVGSVSVNFCNRSTYTAVIRMALATTTSPSNSDWLIYDYELPPGHSLERTGLVLQVGMQVIVYSNQANVSVVVYGFEQEI
jgi:hypothetical protein